MTGEGLVSGSADVKKMRLDRIGVWSVDGVFKVLAFAVVVWLGCN